LLAGGVDDSTAPVSECVGFNVPLDTSQVISGTIFTAQMTKPTVPVLH